MAWSDAARAAALEARRLHQAGKKNTYAYQSAKMRQAAALWSGAMSKYKGSKSPSGSAGDRYWKAKDEAAFAHRQWADNVDPLSAAKHYLAGIKALRRRKI